MTTTTSDLDATWFIDADHPDVRAFARTAVADATTDVERVSALFVAVRDHLRYDPYAVDLRPEAMRASAVLASDRSWCVPKATLLTAALRAEGIPARVGFADVRNHLSTPTLAERMGTDVFMWHGYTEVRVGDATHKITPAFNRELCERFGVEPLDYDGTGDALLHAFDGEGRRHMEYIRDRGTYDDLPLEEMAAELAAAYPQYGSLEGGADVHDEGFHGA